MEIGVAGAGAVGCFFGGLLAKAGHRVTFLARGDHLTTMQKNGLTINPGSKETRIHSTFTDQLSNLSKSDLILFCVKSNDTESMAKQLLPILKKNTLILTMQNGVSNEEILTDIFGSNRVLSAATYVQTYISSPGQVRQQGRVKLVVGGLDHISNKACQAIATTFQQSGIDTTQTDRVLEKKWNKLLWNITFNPLSAIVTARVGDILDDQHLRDTATCISKEAIEVANRSGISIEREKTLAKIFANAEYARDHQTSMMQDRLQGKKMEVEAMCGYIVKKGKELNVSTPALTTVYHILKFIDQHPNGLHK